MDLAYEKSFDLLLFDVKVPHKNGFDLLRELRAKKINTPAIFITSLSSIDDITIAYNAGCDDYLRKPFELKELHLRIQTLLKRNFTQRAIDKLSLGDELYFDLEGLALYKNAELIMLPKKELNLLKSLLSSPNEVIANEELFRVAWSFDEDYSEESLRTHIKNLRKFIGKERLINARGRGYMFVGS
jgi:DNA-binding response OmpR family regulator